MARLAVREIDGLIPLVDPTRVGKAHILDGDNFLVSADGPISAFGRDCMLPNALFSEGDVQTFPFPAGGYTWVFTDRVIYRYRFSQRNLVPMWVKDEAVEPWPWSVAYIGFKWYFARRYIGLLEWDPATDIITLLDDTAVPGLPTNIYGCCAAEARLILLSNDAVSWSALDNGRDFVPDPDTGVGSQLLSILDIKEGDDSPIQVVPFSGGFLTHTRDGILRSEAIQAANPFRHRPLTKDPSANVPIDAFAITTISLNRHITLARDGFYEVKDGKQPELWEPAMGEYFNQEILPALDLTEPGAVHLEYSDVASTLFVSLAEQTQIGIHRRALAFYIPTGQWGELSRSHRALGEFFLDSDIVTEQGTRNGMIGVDGTFWRFSPKSYDTFCPTPEDEGFETMFDVRAIEEWPVRYDVTIPRYYMPCFSRASTDPRIPATQAAPGVYVRQPVDADGLLSDFPEPLAEVTTWDGGATNWDNNNTTWDWFQCSSVSACGLLRLQNVPAPGIRKPLDASILIGVFRGGANEDIDELLQTQELAITALDTAIDDVFEDYMAYDATIDEDWNVEVGDEDWGFGDLGQSSFGVRLCGSIDGTNVWETEEFRQEIKPTLVRVERKTQYFAGSVTGLYHQVHIFTEDVGDSFQIKTLEVNAIPAGVLK